MKCFLRLNLELNKTLPLASFENVAWPLLNVSDEGRIHVGAARALSIEPRRAVELALKKIVLPPDSTGDYKLPEACFTLVRLSNIRIYYKAALALSNEVLDLKNSGSGFGILQSRQALTGDKISSASICIHQPQRSIARHTEEFEMLIVENRRIAGLTPGCSQ